MKAVLFIGLSGIGLASLGVGVLIGRWIDRVTKRR